MLIGAVGVGSQCCIFSVSFRDESRLFFAVFKRLTSETQIENASDAKAAVSLQERAKKR